jgi:dTMP kinase
MKYSVCFEVDFRRNTYGGLYIALEGIDGSGKTRQTRELAEYFRKQGREVVVTSEPRKEKGVIAGLVQRVLAGELVLPSVAFQYLLSADRVMHQEDTIIPALKAGKVVVSDRCFWSVVPYGVYEEGVSLEAEGNFLLATQGLLSMYHRFVAPDVTFYLDVPSDVAYERILQSRREQVEIYEKKEVLARIQRGYEWLLKRFPKEFAVIDGEESVAEVTESMVKIVERNRTNL